MENLNNKKTNETNEINDKEKQNMLASEDIDPFKKNSRLAHSPARTPTDKTRRVGESQSIMDIGSPANRPAEKKDLDTKNSFNKLGEQIGALVDMLNENEGKRRTIHQPMRDAIYNIKSLYHRAATEMGNCNSSGTVCNENSTQTSPWPRITAELKRKKAGPEAMDSPRNKRRKEEAEGKMQPVGKAHASASSHPAQPKPTNEWTLVKKTPKKAKQIVSKSGTGRVRPDAIIIEKTGNSSYADILKKVKSDEKFKNLAESVSKIRRTQKGDLLIELKKSCQKSTDFKTIVGATLGSEATVKALTHRTTIECKDIDEVTSKEEVHNAIKSLPGFDDVELADITGLRAAYAGTQTATISLPALKAKKLLEIGKVKIGWVICRLRERISLQKCYRCLQYGHMSRNCSSEIDRSKQCRKCGIDGHFAKDCQNSPKCVLCKAERKENINHIAGSYRCPEFRRALTNRRQ